MPTNVNNNNREGNMAMEKVTATISKNHIKIQLTREVDLRAVYNEQDDDVRYIYWCKAYRLQLQADMRLRGK